MYLLSFEEWITTVFVRALGWTFTHSLWQGLVALLAAYMMLAMMKRAKPSARYNMLLGISLLFIGVVAATFVFQLGHYKVADKIADNSLSLQILYNESSAASPVIMESKRILDVMMNYFNRYLHILVTSWFIIFCVKWLRLSLNLNYVSRISRFESAPANAAWQQLCDRLKNNLGIGRDVKLLHSNIVKVPLVSGILRPLILVPAGMLANMPADVIESILLHELGHIKRNDYLVNIIQSVAETVFFFNPFMVKLSALIREEREACCDAIAVNITNNKVSYVQALVAFGEYSSAPAPLLAFAGTKNHLLQRAKRILYNQNKKPGFMEKSILFGSVIMLSVITAFTSIKNEQRPAAPVNHGLKTIVYDTVPDDIKEEENVNVDTNDNNDNGDEPSASENRKRKKRMRETEQKLEKKQKEFEQLQQKVHEIRIQIDNDVQLKNMILQKKLIEVQNRVNLQNAKIQAQQKLQLAHAEKAIKDIELQKINRDVEKAMKNIQLEKMNKELQSAITLNRIEHGKLLAEHDFDMSKHKVMFDSLSQKLSLTIRPGYMNDDIASILEFLEENDVANAKDIKTFTLNNDELIVNGQKQSSTLHEQLKERYIRDKDDHFIYSNSNGSKSITIRRNDPS